MADRNDSMADGFAAADHACLELPDGRIVQFELRRSARAHAVYLKLTPREGLVVTAPRRAGRASVLKVVEAKARWIARHLARFDAERDLAPQDRALRPVSFELAALAESWRVEYNAARLPGVAARTRAPGLIVVSGAVDDIPVCQSALRRWLARHAVDAFSPWLSGLARAHGLRYGDLSIRSQRARWGSCAHGGRISLNCKLLFLPRELVSYVMVHELGHLLEANHSHRFWAHVRRMEPATDELRRAMRGAWKWVPGWAD